MTRATSTAPPPAAPLVQVTPPLRTPPAGRPTRVALVGAGYIADFHLEILAPLEAVEVVAVCDPVLARAEALAAKWGVPRAVASVAELAGLGVDVAHLLVPPDLHARLVRELLEADLGCYVEKPLALSAAEGRELVALAAARGLVLGVNHNHVHQPAFQRLLERVERGDIGVVEHVQVTWSVPLMQLDAEQYAHWMFRSPRNIVFEQAPHPLSQVHRLLGRVQSCETKILSTRELLPGQVFHDRWLVSARGERGTAEVYLAFGQGFTRNTIQVLGSDGCLEADFAHDALAGERKTVFLDFWNSFLAGWRRGGEYRRDARRVLRQYLAATLKLAPRQDAYFAGMRDSVSAFHRALRAGAALPTDGARATEVLEWCDAVAADVSGASAPALPLSDAPARPGEVVVLGGTGFIGKRVVERLLAADVPVTCLVRRTHSLPPVIERGARDGRVRLLRGSLEDAGDLARVFAGARAVLHLAPGGGATWAETEQLMVRGSVGIAEACLAQGVQRFVYVSSVAALYTGDEHAPPLADSPAVDPQPAARSAYARGKAETELALQRLVQERGLPLVVLRPGVVIGEGTPMQHTGYGMWARDNHCVGWGDGEHPLPLVWVDDVADAIVAATRYAGDDLHGQALNLCAKAPLGAREVIAELRRATGRDLHFHPRSLGLSQLMEVGKWAVKLAGRRPGLEFPSWRDLRARALFTVFECDLARTKLGWTPLEDREGLLDAAVRVYGKGR
ncbi:MAG: NAD-dependent epimerase/dehydratase family protein [Planctomycetes bacterium]|nr:NAD-dependent epimerase/dehydratase family protein [Planctomycetota bacterium]